MNIERIVQELKKGNLVITPTDTVYGILSKALDIDVIEKVYNAKKRAKNKSFIVLVNGINMLKDIVLDISDIQYQFIEKYWPGKVTIIFKKNDKIPFELTGGRDTIAVRYPNHKDLCDILDIMNEPLISTSANISNNDTITNIHMIDQELLEHISYVEDGGEIQAQSSTIVEFIDNKIHILRAGELSEDIKENFSVIE